MGVSTMNQVGIFILIAGSIMTILGTGKRITKTWGIKEGKRDYLLPVGIVVICLGVILAFVL